MEKRIDNRDDDEKIEPQNFMAVVFEVEKPNN